MEPDAVAALPDFRTPGSPAVEDADVAAAAVPVRTLGGSSEDSDAAAAGAESPSGELLPVW